MAVNEEMSKQDRAVKKLIHRMPVEVITFYTAAIGIIQSIPETVIDPASNYILLSVAFLLGIALVLILVQRNQNLRLGSSQSILILISFILWAWTIGSPMTLIIEYFSLWTGIPAAVFTIWALFISYAI